MLFLTKNFIKSNTKKVLKKSTTKRSSINYKDAKSIGIIFTVTNRIKHTEVRNFIKKLKADGKEVEVLCLLGTGKENYDFVFDYFTKKEFSIFGKITSPSLNSFIQKKFDYVFHLDTSLGLFIENALAKSQAKCRVGMYQEGKDSFYELMFKTKKDDGFQIFLGQLYGFVKSLS